MKTVKVSELKGAALDWAVAEAEDVQTEFVRNRLTKMMDSGGTILIPSIRDTWSPSTDWSQGGPLIEEYFMMVDIDISGDTEAKAYLKDGSHWTCFGQSPLVAVCRAIVGLNEKDDTIEIPDELA